MDAVDAHGFGTPRLRCRHANRLHDQSLPAATDISHAPEPYVEKQYFRDDHMHNERRGEP